MSAFCQSRRAFTLIEVLIVVVILGILATVVLPQFSNATEVATENTALSQLRTLRGQVAASNGIASLTPFARLERALRVHRSC